MDIMLDLWFDFNKIHSGVTYFSIDFVFFPKNITSVFQDFGIFQSIFMISVMLKKCINSWPVMDSDGQLPINGPSRTLNIMFGF